MKNKILKVAAILGIAVFVFSPMCIKSVNAIDIPGSDSDIAPIASTYTDPKSVMKKFINTAVTVLAGIAVLFIIYGGFHYITGGDKAAESAKKMITNAVVGLVIILLAYALVYWVVNTFVGVK